MSVSTDLQIAQSVTMDPLGEGAARLGIAAEGVDPYGKCKAKLALSVIVATVRALKYHGGEKLEGLKRTNIDAVRKGFVNLTRPIDNVGWFGVPAVAAINRFTDDTDGNITGLI